ncbi:MAG: DNA recombination/repair protein RecA, partial [bacterium]|nr:DNA recombination/repair protein RecA [bacterium]
MAKATKTTGEATRKSKPIKAGSASQGTAGKKREKALDAALQQIEKNFGTGSIMKLAGDQITSVKGIPTGALSLDIALGGQGMPKGRICELYGPEGSGKTTLALHVIACAQKGDGVAAFIDAEHALDPTWARKLGVDIEDMLVSQPDT